MRQGLLKWKGCNGRQEIQSVELTATETLARGRWYENAHFKSTSTGANKSNPVPALDLIIPAQTTQRSNTAYYGI